MSEPDFGTPQEAEGRFIDGLKKSGFFMTDHEQQLIRLGFGDGYNCGWNQGYITGSGGRTKLAKSLIEGAKISKEAYESGREPL